MCSGLRILSSTWNVYTFLSLFPFYFDPFSSLLVASASPFFPLLPASLLTKSEEGWTDKCCAFNSQQIPANEFGPGTWWKRRRWKCEKLFVLLDGRRLVWVLVFNKIPRDFLPPLQHLHCQDVLYVYITSYLVWLILLLLLLCSVSLLIGT